MIGKGQLSMKSQCKLLSIHRSGIYYKPSEESELNLNLMRMMDEHYLHHPFKGASRMHTWLTRDKGFQVSKNRVERLYYQVMGLRAVMPGKHTSRRHKAHKTFPYLLRNSEVFADYVLGQGITLSMDGKGRAIDNAFIERLWRSIKYEKLYLNPPKDGIDLYLLVAEYFNYYNMERGHSGIDNQIPEQLYFQLKKEAA